MGSAGASPSYFGWNLKVGILDFEVSEQFRPSFSHCTTQKQICTRARHAFRIALTVRRRLNSGQ
jgi:hypothetical protein